MNLAHRSKELRPALLSLLKQATEERSHLYVAKVVCDCLALLDEVDETLALAKSILRRPTPDKEPTDNG